MCFYTRLCIYLTFPGAILGGVLMSSFIITWYLSELRVYPFSLYIRYTMSIEYSWRIIVRGRRGRDRMVVGFTTTYPISAYHHWCCEFQSRSGRGVQHQVCQRLVTGRWFCPGPPVSSTNKTDRHDIAEILLKVALNTIKQTNKTLRITFTSHIKPVF